LLEPNLVPDAWGSPGVYWNSPGISNDDNSDDQLMILKIETNRFFLSSFKKFKEKKGDETARMDVVCCTGLQRYMMRLQAKLVVFHALNWK
jgi:hypothetical protein